MLYNRIVNNESESIRAVCKIGLMCNFTVTDDLMRVQDILHKYYYILQIWLIDSLSYKMQ